MEHFPYKQAAIFATEADARLVEQRILKVDFPDLLVYLLSPDDLDSKDQKLDPENIPASKSEAVVRKAFYGGTGGALTGAAASLTAGTFKLALFASHPVAVTLAAIGYGATLGATGGAIIGKSLHAELFIGVLEEALGKGQWAVIVHAPDKETARKVSVLLEHVQGAENRVHN
ncbi:MAG: hypothetical protein R3E95_09195 [Thiolinea sp.]